MKEQSLIEIREKNYQIKGENKLAENELLLITLVSFKYKLVDDY